MAGMALDGNVWVSFQMVGNAPETNRLIGIGFGRDNVTQNRYNDRVTKMPLLRRGYAPIMGTEWDKPELRARSNLALQYGLHLRFSRLWAGRCHAEKPGDDRTPGGTDPAE